MIKRISKKWLYVILLTMLAVRLLMGGRKEEIREVREDLKIFEKGIWPVFSGEKVLEEVQLLFTYAGGREEETGLLARMGRRVLEEVPIYGYCMAVTDLQLPEETGNQEIREESRTGEEGQEETEQGEDEKSEAEKGEAEKGEKEERDQIEWEELVQAMEAENSEKVFVPHAAGNSYDWDALQEYKNLVSTFYTVDAGTMIGSDQLNVEKLNRTDFSIDKTAQGPHILIYHTHSLEAFADSSEGDRSQTIVGVGDRLTQILEEQYGYQVMHHTEEYDTVRDDAYANSLPDLEKILEENPGIQVIIDLHRDAGVEGVRRVIELDGRPTATFMFFNGLSRTKKTGDIAYLKNPNLDDNLAFSFQLQVKAGEYYPGLTRKIYLKGYRYNMHLLPRTLLVELGDSNNTVEEAMNTCDPLAHVLDLVLSGENE